MPAPTAPSRDQILREQAAIAARVAELSKKPDHQRLAALANAEAELAGKREQLAAIQAAELAAEIAKVQPALDRACIVRAQAFAKFIEAEAAVEQAALVVEDVSRTPVRGWVAMFGLSDWLGTLAVQREDPVGFKEAGLRISSLANNRVAVERIK